MYAIISVSKMGEKFIAENGFYVVNISDAVDVCAPYFPGSKQLLLDELELLGYAQMGNEYPDCEVVRVEVFEDDLRTNPVNSMAHLLSPETFART